MAFYSTIGIIWWHFTEQFALFGGILQNNLHYLVAFYSTICIIWWHFRTMGIIWWHFTEKFALFGGILQNNWHYLVSFYIIIGIFTANLQVKTKAFHSVVLYDGPF